MRALIVDDEPLARRGVSLRLRRFADVEIVGECANGLSAIYKILQLSPDDVFLDVQMPDMDGFEVLRAVPKENIPAVVFITAYDQYALRAFEAYALDYLLKPVDDARFAAAVGRVREHLDSASRQQDVKRILDLLEHKGEHYVSRFALRSGSRIQIVMADEIEWIAASGDYAELHAGGRSHLLRETMKSLERRLDPKSFLRIHRSRIVRANCIRSLRGIENREYVLKLSDGSEHRCSRTYVDRLESWLASGRD